MNSSFYTNFLNGFRSSHGRKKLEISATSSGRALKTEIKKVMDLDQDFIVRRDNKGRPGKLFLQKQASYSTKR